MLVRKENDYLIISNREKCKQILQKQSISKEDIMDFLISLHLVLEVWLNTFYRHIILTQIKKNISHISVAKNLDSISFIDKTILFFYLPRFEFHWNENIAEEYHKAIWLLKNFSEVRNKLLHGHMIWEVFVSDSSEQSKLFQITTPKFMYQQIEDFKFILDAIYFYSEHLEYSIANTEKMEYLRYDFLSME